MNKFHPLQLNPIASFDNHVLVGVDFGCSPDDVGYMTIEKINDELVYTPISQEEFLKGVSDE